MVRGVLFFFTPSTFPVPTCTARTASTICAIHLFASRRTPALAAASTCHIHTFCPVHPLHSFSRIRAALPRTGLRRAFFSHVVPSSFSICSAASFRPCLPFPSHIYTCLPRLYPSTCSVFACLPQNCADILLVLAAPNGSAPANSKPPAPRTLMPRPRPARRTTPR
ncbi:hypothetical protein B0H16DRAFT_794781 [Mycena metata]|uniref:Uncharacterized protein n=1 Tax=Mycena metata TaxID=1033252 RepID=A0AAD7NA87_9AGAR|nr:hypothetical protein B0H16DRAFT_794781 [Mycena metata]